MEKLGPTLLTQDGSIYGESYAVELPEDVAPLWRKAFEFLGDPDVSHRDFSASLTRPFGILDSGIIFDQVVENDNHRITFFRGPRQIDIIINETSGTACILKRNLSLTS